MKYHLLVFWSLLSFVLTSCAELPPEKELAPTVTETPRVKVEEKKEAALNPGLQAQLRDPADMFTYQGADGKEATSGNRTVNQPTQPWNKEVEKPDVTLPKKPLEKP